jgi:hypothetical protein
VPALSSSVVAIIAIIVVVVAIVALVVLFLLLMYLQRTHLDFLLRRFRGDIGGLL